MKLTAMIAYLVSPVCTALCSQVPLGASALYPSPQLGSVCRNPVVHHSEVVGTGPGYPINLTHYTCDTVGLHDNQRPSGSTRGGGGSTPQPAKCPSGNVAERCECEELCGKSAGCSYSPPPERAACERIAEWMTSNPGEFVFGE
ncbi:hypothetical protein BXZ70DRAFT_654227 [Cristinia sonorae]|uniref:Uncharacterized protein n=1 Tax=Cristinia sonorae TaxID=1940300 RepID=A0A8K0UEQ1_9AGAR|nr:hypothetical protein BXZ70DRAFT_654227 [Cristinia sonorae]